MFIPAQPKLVADFLGVIVFLTVDGMTAPAHGNIWVSIAVQDACMTQGVKYTVGDTGGTFGVENAGVGQHRAHVNNVPEHGKQVFAQSPYHPAINESLLGGVGDFQANSAILLE